MGQRFRVKLGKVSQDSNLWCAPSLHCNDSGSLHKNFSCEQPSMPIKRLLNMAFLLHVKTGKASFVFD